MSSHGRYSISTRHPSNDFSPIWQVMYPDEVDKPMYEEVIQTAQFALPCLFAFQYALTTMWEVRLPTLAKAIAHVT